MIQIGLVIIAVSAVLFIGNTYCAYKHKHGKFFPIYAFSVLMFIIGIIFTTIGVVKHVKEKRMSVQINYENESSK